MRGVAMIVALVLGLVAQAGTCVWTGGSGRWSNPANWRDGTLPVAGDTVYVSNTVANITINLDTAGISIASIRFEGEGPVEVVGEALTLTSDWYLRGTGVNNVMDYPGSRLPWFAWNARVTCRVPLTLNTTGGSTGVCSCFNDMEFEKSIEIVGTRNFYVHSGYNPSAAETAVGMVQSWRNVMFRGPITGAGTTFRVAQYPNGIVYAYGPINVKHMWVSGWGSGRLCLGSNSNSWETIRTDYNNRYLALVEGAFPTNSVFELDSTYLSSTGYFNLGNNNMTIDRLNDPAAALAMHAGQTGKSGWVRSASTIDCDAGSTFAPVTLTLKGTADGCSAIGFADAVSLVWDPVGDFTQTLTGRVSLTTGAISVKRGTLEFASGTSFPNVRRYAIASGAKLKLAAGVAVSAQMVLAGDSYVPNGVYSGVAAEGVTQVDWLAGAGTLTVNVGNAGVWKAAVSGNWEDAANWLSGEVPTATSDVYLTVPSATDYTVKVNVAISTFPVNLTVNNEAGGLATLEFAANATQVKGSVVLGVGGRVVIDEGVQFLYRGMEPEEFNALSWTQKNQTLKKAYTFAVAGGEWFNNGGTTVITNFAGTSVLSGTATQKGRLTVRGGLLRYMDLNSSYPLTVSKGGLLDVQDAQLHLPHHGYNHLTDLGVAGGEVVISNTAMYTAGVFPTQYGGSVSFGSGTTTFSGSSSFKLYTGNHFVKPGQAGETAKVLFTDNAAIKSDFLPWYLGLMAGGRAEMVYASTNLMVFPLFVGVDAGTGVFTIPVGGKARIHSYGLTVGASSQAAVGSALPTSDGVEGFVEVDGQLTVPGSFHPGWASSQRPSGLSLGYGGYTAVRSGRPYVGHMTVRGTYSQEAGHAIVGGGYAAGDFTLAGGSATFFTLKMADDCGGPTASSLLVGLAGGAGRFTVSNGTAVVKNGNVYVGGCSTNAIYMCSVGEAFGSNVSSTSWTEKGFPADSLDGEGTFSMAGGSFTAQNTFTVGAFGSGTVEMIGCAPSLTVKDMVLSNNVASTVRFVADANGFAPITVQNALTIAEGAELVVDFSAYEGASVKFPLFTFASVSGTIAPERISVTGRSLHTPCVLQNTGTGLSLVFSRGTQIIFR